MVAIIFLYPVFFFFFFFKGAVKPSVDLGASVSSFNDFVLVAAGFSSIILQVEAVFLMLSSTSTSAVAGAAAGVCLFLMLAIQHLEQHPPVASEPKNPHPDLHSMGTFGACLLLALMMCVVGVLGLEVCVYVQYSVYFFQK